MPTSSKLGFALKFLLVLLHFELESAKLCFNHILLLLFLLILCHSCHCFHLTNNICDICHFTFEARAQTHTHLLIYYICI